MDPWSFPFPKCNESIEKGRFLENNRSSTEPKIGYLHGKMAIVRLTIATSAIARSFIARSFIARSVMAGVLRELIPENTMVSIGMGQAKQVLHKAGAA